MGCEYIVDVIEERVFSRGPNGVDGTKERGEVGAGPAHGGAVGVWAISIHLADDWSS